MKLAVFWSPLMGPATGLQLDPVIAQSDPSVNREPESRTPDSAGVRANRPSREKKALEARSPARRS
jgi:hypothetical protein